MRTVRDGWMLTDPLSGDSLSLCWPTGSRIFGGPKPGGNPKCACLSEGLGLFARGRSGRAGPFTYTYNAGRPSGPYWAALGRFAGLLGPQDRLT